ncbi:MAG TPA: hypothetical protein VMH39_04085 [Gemmatimonadaceae bacterium]|nr:hypothetical protein [Gemmatimonadaceae bacterium]
MARRFNAPALDIHLSSDFPLGAGLGGSSAAGVAAIAALAAWQGRVYELDQLAETSRAIETGELGIAGGRQDHYAAAYGGALALKFGTRVEVRRLRVDGATRGELARRGILIYTGQSRISGDTISAVLDAYRRADPTVVRALRRMRELAQQMPEALERGNLDWLGSLVAEQWAAQRTLHPGIATPRIDAIIDRAVRAGAVGAKALGASGGGCVLVIAMSNRVPEVREAIAPLGELLEYEVDTGGVARCG